MTLYIHTPEKTIYGGEAESVSVPGKNQQPFVILDSHAPIIAILEAGVVKYAVEHSELKLNISGGFVEVRDNVVTICVEL
jgi:F-type H+-transporting ATPase subunit epsilon